MAADDSHHTELGFVMEGEIDISERKNAEPPHSSLELVECRKSVKVELGYAADADICEDEGFYLSLYCYHAKNEETGRVFHGSLRVYPDRDQVRRIRDYCNYLLTLGDGGAGGN